jgi:hypothetical protein
LRLRPRWTGVAAARKQSGRGHEANEAAAGELTP